MAFGLILLFIFPISDMSSSSEGEIIQPTSSTFDHSSLIEENNQPSTEEVQQKIMVDVKGMVKYPGVYELPAGSRMIDAIEIAGGHLPESDASSINHAQILSDEMAIYIPYKGEETVAAVQLFMPEADDGKININTADETMLTSLPGIGPSKAKAIVSFREENGLFTSPEDLKKVTGIGDKTYEQLEDQIKIK
ncbi:helix-hairpin-helix domain-containing protein [Chungangia koreensis]|uniref:Helix-hairpin-helix domain-containing protein n=1 Tax=Chungangia koreensis TaxID=752657 RepID=A0ABV8X7E8_9LACT